MDSGARLPCLPLASRANRARKIIGRDAWRFGKFVLSRVPLETDATRYYIVICLVGRTGQTQGKAVGYWLEVRPLALTTAVE